MPLYLKKSDTYTWPINFKMPIDNGKHQTVKFQCKFQRLKQSEIEDYQKRLSVTDLDALFKTSRECAKKVIVGWVDVLDEDENEIEFNENNLDVLLELPTLAIAVSTTYINSLTEAKVKN